MKIKIVDKIIAYSGEVKKLDDKIVSEDTNIRVTSSAMREIIDSIEVSGLQETINKLKDLGISNTQLFERDLPMRSMLIPIDHSA